MRRRSLLAFAECQLAQPDGLSVQNTALYKTVVELERLVARTAEASSTLQAIARENEDFRKRAAQLRQYGWGRPSARLVLCSYLAGCWMRIRTCSTKRR